MSSKVFEDVSVEFNGETKVIPANKVLKLIAQLEEIQTLPELMAMRENKDFSISKISSSYGTLLRYAGFDIDDEGAYEAVAVGSIDVAVNAILAIILIMIPPKAARKAQDIEDKKTSKPPLKKRRSKSSKKPIKL